MPLGKTGWAEYKKELEYCLGKIRDYSPDVLLIPLGVDTYEGDPISEFKLKANDFDKIGAMIKSANMPTLFVMEGGYDVEELGSNTLNVLLAFDDTTVYKSELSTYSIGE